MTNDILRNTFVRSVELYDELPSTSDLALRRAADAVPTPLLIAARRQTAGRGRGANRWWGGDGALTFSLLIEPQAAHVEPRHWPQFSLAAAVAVCSAVETLAAELRPAVKWPNDIYCAGRKLAGILIEVPARSITVPVVHCPNPPSARRMVIGIGLNVNNSWQQAPAALQDVGTSLLDLTGRAHELTDVLVALLVELEKSVVQLAQGDARLPRAWQARSLLTGRRVAIDQGSRLVSGLCEGIDSDGALLLAGASGQQRILGGVVKSVD